MERALATWRPGYHVYAHAANHNVNPSALYRALKRTGKKKGRNGK